MTTKATIQCKKCGRTMDESNFYISKNIEKYPPNGKMDTCKKCLTMHVNSWEPTTFIGILKEINVPYIEKEWNTLLDKHGKDPTKVTGLTILGRYLSKMKLNQYKHLMWEDTEALAKENEKRKRIQQAQIDAQKNRYAAALTSVELKNLEGKTPDDLTDEDFENMTDEELGLIFAQPDKKKAEVDDWQPYNPEEPTEVNPMTVVSNAPEDMLTREDTLYLTLKWGKLYRPEEWISLEKFYDQMNSSFDIQGAAHKDYLKKICKTSLKMDQAIDCGDIEGFQKLSKVYDLLMKSAKFTAAQNKAENGEFVDSVGELVFLAEEMGFIPRFHTDEPKDIVDITLKDMKGYNYKLVTEEMGLGNMIEAALKQMEREQLQEEGDLDENDEFINPEATGVLEDIDHEDYYNELEEQAAIDAEIINGEGE